MPGFTIGTFHVVYRSLALSFITLGVEVLIIHCVSVCFIAL
jgi:hypothetical protein